MRWGLAIAVVVVLVLCRHQATAFFPCECNYNTETTVYQAPDAGSDVIGYLYEFDCKPAATVDGNNTEFKAIWYERKIGYVEVNEQLKHQDCDGEPDEADMVLPSEEPKSTKVSDKPEFTTSPTTGEQTTPPVTELTSPTTTRALLIETEAAQTTTTPIVRATEVTSRLPIENSDPTNPGTRPPTTLTTPTEGTTSPTEGTTSPTEGTTSPTEGTTPPFVFTTPPMTEEHTTVRTTSPTEGTTPPTVRTTFEFTTPPTRRTTTWVSTITTPSTTTTVDPVIGTPLENVGVGYNLLTGNPELASDPGLNLHRRVLQLREPSEGETVATYDETDDCQNSESNLLLLGSKSLQDEMDGFVTAYSESTNAYEVAHPDHVTSASYTKNDDFEASRQELDVHNMVYQDAVISCQKGTAKYFDDFSAYAVSKEFAAAICGLPDNLETEENMNMYWHFMDEWGTSVVMEADFGTRTITRYTALESELFAHARDSDESLLTQAGPIDGYGSSLIINKDAYMASGASSQALGTASTMSVGTDEVPALIGLNVVPIYKYINKEAFAQVLDGLTGSGVCSDHMYDDGLVTIAANMQAAMNQYPSRRLSPLEAGSYTQVKDKPMQIPITWPAGTYGMMKTTSGCPSGFNSGWRHYDTEDINENNGYTSGIAHYLAGEFGHDIRTDFCVKTSTSTTGYETIWEAGSYCLLKKGSCSNGFTSGYIYWDDEDLGNANEKGGSLPDGEYDRNTKIYYCCRNDGQSNQPIYLPTETPFALVRYGTTCQQVHNMASRDLYIHWDDNDLFNGNDVGGMHPADEGDGENHQLHFCYYESSAGTSGGDPVGK